MDGFLKNDPKLILQVPEEFHTSCADKNTMALTAEF